MFSSLFTKKLVFDQRSELEKKDKSEFTFKQEVDVWAEAPSTICSELITGEGRSIIRFLPAF